jgi:hypothetical protein
MPQGRRQGVGETGAHQQGAGQSRPPGIGDGVQVGQAQPRLLQDRPGQGDHPADVIPGRQFRHHAAVFGVHGHLGMDPVGQQASLGIEHGQAGFIAGGFNAKDSHGLATGLSGQAFG